MRKPAQHEQPKSAAYRIFYGLIVLSIVCAWIYAFRAYFAHYDSMHPEIAWAVPWVQVDIVQVDGILLWDEEAIASPRDGTVKYPLGRGPVRVPKGAIVARVSSGSVAADVKSKNEGYFIAGLDGMEGKWRYSMLWPGMKELPDPPPVVMMGEDSRVKKNELIGKIVNQPQELRLIGYVDLAEGMEEKIASNRIMVKMDPLDTPSRAHVRVFEPIGHKAKIHLNLPWFPPQVLLSRKHKLLVETGEDSGVAVPESAVGVKDGKKGAYVLKGAEASFVEVKGRIIDGSKFLVTEGVKLGDAVIVDADEAREGKVRLW
jgi:hypothetical protein